MKTAAVEAENAAVNMSSPLSTVLSDLTTSMMTTEMVSDSVARNLSRVWKQEEVQSLGERARVVLSQPVAILSLSLCLLSLLANLLSITATLLGPNGLTTHLKLVVSLSLSDMLLSVSTLSNLLNRIFNTMPDFATPPEDRLAFACASTFHFALNTMAIVISLLNLLVMALDHYVAIMNPLHYPTLLSRANGTLIICFIWSVAFLGGCTVFFADVSEFSKVSRHLNYCEYVQYSDYQGEYLVFAIAFISFFVITYTYVRIYVEVRRTYRNGLVNRLDYARNRKALLTSLLIIGTFMFCWLPTCLFQIALLIQVHVDKVKVHRMYATLLRANRYLNALLPLNSFCDPIIYAFRLRDVQLGYRRLSQKCFSRRHKRLNSLRSSVMRQTQTLHLPLVDIPSKGGGRSQRDVNSQCNKLHGVCYEHKLKRDDGDSATDITPMISAAAASTMNGVCNGGVPCQHQSQQPLLVRKSGDLRRPLCRVCNVHNSGSVHRASQV